MARELVIVALLALEAAACNGHVSSTESFSNVGYVTMEVATMQNPAVFVSAQFYPHVATPCGTAIPSNSCLVARCPTFHPSGLGVSGGTVTVVGGIDSATLVPFVQPDGVSYPPHTDWRSTFFSGPLTVTVTGETAPAFTGGVAFPATPTISAPVVDVSLVVDSTVDLNLRWEPIGAGEIFVDLLAPEGKTEQFRLLCFFDGALAHAVVPAAKLGQFKAGAPQTSYAPYLSIGSIMRSSVMQGDWRMELRAMFAVGEATVAIR